MSFKVDLARPLMLGTFDIMLGTLNCAESNLSTGFETRSDFLLDDASDPAAETWSDFLLDDASDPATRRFVVCSPSSVMRS